MNKPLTLKIQQYTLPYGGDRFKGRLLAGLPSRNKPRETNHLEWCASILKLAEAEGIHRLAIPLSFWPDGIRPFGDDGFRLEQPPHIVVPDQPGTIGSVECEAPRYSIEKIVENLRRGEDVLVLTATKKISGFIPAVLGILMHPDCHIEKLLWPIQYAGCELTPAQCGYVAGLQDSESLTRLKLALGWGFESVGGERSIE